MLISVKMIPRSSSLITPLIIVACIGCGGEDFSAPPSDIQKRLADAKASAADPAAAPEPPAETKAETAEGQPAAPTGEAPDAQATPPAAEPSASTTDAPGSPEPEGKPVPEGDSKPEDTTSPAPSTDSMPKQDGTQEPASPDTAKPEMPVAPVTSPAPPAASGDSAPTPSQEPGGETSTETASGKSAEEIEKKKEENSEQGVMGNAGGLLAALKGSTPDTAAANPEAPAALTRFGRTAISAPQWLQLVSKLTRKFFASSTPGATRLIGSSGERSAGVLTTQIDYLPVRPDEVILVTPPEPVMQSIESLPGLINAVELSSDGTKALFGTTDGRLLVRSTAGMAEWDLYARDFFLFQEERRAVARLSDEAIVAIRCFPNGKVLTVDGNSLCALWNFADIVREPEDIQAVTPEKAKSAEGESFKPVAQTTVQLAGFRILSISFSTERQLAAVVTSAEEVVILNTETGAVVATLKAEQFANTQPVCIEFYEGRSEIFAGLADGRIIRRSFGEGAESVKGTDDQGNPVDYDTVFVPEVEDTRGAITCLKHFPGSTVLYAGSLEGFIGRINTQEKKIEVSSQRHQGPVYEILLSKAGVVSFGMDRKVLLFDMPYAAGRTGEGYERTYQLPIDESIAEVAEDPAQTTPQAGKSTRPVRKVTPVAVVPDQSLINLRPSDPVLALREHQLRTVKSDRSMPVRIELLKHVGNGTRAQQLSQPEPDAEPGIVQKQYEIPTEFNYSISPWQRVLLHLSDDGMTAIALHRQGDLPAPPLDRAEAITAWDLPTGTVLRRWTQPGQFRQLGVYFDRAAVYSSTGDAQLNLMTGRFASEPQSRHSSFAVVPDGRSMVFGEFGLPGQLGKTLKKLDPTTGDISAGLELFEAAVTAMTYSTDGKSLYVSVRERDLVRLLELDPVTFQLKSELLKESVAGKLDEAQRNATDQIPGATVMQFSPSGNLMAVYGNYGGTKQLRILKKIKDKWPLDQAIVISASDAALDFEITSRPFIFVSGQDNRIALLTKTGILIVNLKKGTVEFSQAIPDFQGHRPVVEFSPDGNWALAGDAEGVIWAMDLRVPVRKPRQFPAHTGPVSGMSFSGNGKYLLTSGEDNRLKSWRMDGFFAEVKKESSKPEAKEPKGQQKDDRDSKAKKQNQPAAESKSSKKQADEKAG